METLSLSNLKSSSYLPAETGQCFPRATEGSRRRSSPSAGFTHGRSRSADSHLVPPAYDREPLSTGRAVLKRSMTTDCSSANWFQSPVRNRLCLDCRKRKIRCIRDYEPEPCDRCVRRGLQCECIAVCAMSSQSLSLTAGRRPYPPHSTTPTAPSASPMRMETFEEMLDDLASMTLPGCKGGVNRLDELLNPHEHHNVRTNQDEAQGVAEIARRYGPYTKPEDLGGDSSDLIDTLLHKQGQRAALLAQGLSFEDLRGPLRSCEQRISSALLAVLYSSDAINAVLRLKGDRAQSFLDTVQDVLDRGSLPSTEHTAQARRLTRRLLETRDQLPSSLFISGVTDVDEHPTFSGGFGDIHRASYQRKTVALKRIRTFNAGAGSQQGRRQFWREASVWQNLEHPNILRLLGVDRESFPSSVCMVSLWMKNGTVLKYLSEHGRGYADKLLLQVAEGLGYLHSKKIVHGDLRGTNILVSDEGNACLADFGLASVIEGSTTDGALTSSTNHAGSVRWFAPELIQPKSFGCEKFKRTPASDVYAFACVCLELHTGGAPFSDVSPDIAAMFLVIAGDRPARHPSMSDGLWTLVKAAWAQNARDRPEIGTIIESMKMIL